MIKVYHIMDETTSTPDGVHKIRNCSVVVNKLQFIRPFDGSLKQKIRNCSVVVNKLQFVRPFDGSLKQNPLGESTQGENTIGGIVKLPKVLLKKLNLNELLSHTNTNEAIPLKLIKTICPESVHSSIDADDVSQAKLNDTVSLQSDEEWT